MRIHRLSKVRTIAAELAAFGLVVSACSSTGSKPSGSVGPVSEFVKGVQAEVGKLQEPQTQWTGPTTGPKAKPGIRLVYLSGQQSNSLDAAYGSYLQAAAKRIGWTVDIIDGQGTPTGWLAGMNQAVARRPNGILFFADATSLQGPIQAAKARHIPVVGLHAAATPGPGQGMFTNIQQDAGQIGKAEADYAIAIADGHAKAVIVTHNEYAIARIKTDAMKAELQKCSTCKLLKEENFPGSEGSSRMAQITSSLVTAYGKDFQAMSVGDNDWDFAVPTLKAGSAGKTVKLIGSDGTTSAYVRIRSGDYQVATVPEPAQEEAYYGLYQTNLALHGQKAASWVPPVYLVTAKNVDAEGGKNNVFDPSNHYKEHFFNLLTQGHS